MRGEMRRTVSGRLKVDVTPATAYVALACAAIFLGLCGREARAQAAKVDTTKLNEVLATVNGSPITRGDFIGLVSKTPINPGEEELIYNQAIDQLVNQRLLTAFLTRQKLVAPKDKIDAAVEGLKKELEQTGKDLPNVLADAGMTLDEVREQYAIQIRWNEYVNQMATEAELKKFYAQNKDLFDRAQVKVSHILIGFEPDASAADKAKAKAKADAVRAEVEAGKLSFAQAADKYSQDPNKTEGDGGDIGFILRDTLPNEQFTRAAFALKKNEVSQPVETEFGYHLIQTTERLEGKPLDLERQRPLVMNRYALNLQKSIIEAERKSAKLDVKPMPKDLFPPAPKPTEGTAKPVAPK